MRIHIAEDYTPYPGGREPKDGDYNGQRFREEYLIPLLEQGGVVTVTLDGLASLPTSFAEEAFGGLVRRGFREGLLKQRMEFVVADSLNQSWAAELWGYISDAEKQILLKKPCQTRPS